MPEASTSCVPTDIFNATIVEVEGEIAAEGPFQAFRDGKVVECSKASTPVAGRKVWRF